MTSSLVTKMLAAFVQTVKPAPTKISVLYGDLRTGRIYGEIDVTGTDWAQTLNTGGSVDQVTVPDAEIARLDLWRNAPAARTFLAVEVNDRIQEAGPIWSRSYDWETGTMTLGAAGLWSLFDHRMVVKVLAAALQVRTGADLGSVTLTGADLGEIARALVALAMSHVGGDLPLDLPDPRPGDAHTETFNGYELLILGDQLRRLTQRQTAAPDIRFTAYRDPDDRRFLRWRMETGTEAAPQLSQVGADWVLDTTARRGPVLGIGLDEDATVMGFRGWEIGTGSEEDQRMAMAYDPTLVTSGSPLLEVEESRTSDSEQDTLDGYASQLVARSGRPVQVWKATVHISAALEVTAGDYAVVKTKGHACLGTGSYRVRVQKKSGDLTDRVVLDMFPLEAIV